ncbi:MAG TPA: hypothetical protein VFU53_00570, partial [Burkholderiales bacterium]|nr:hypothetical protein [Burkholderiales bacterium]
MCSVRWLAIVVTMASNAMALELPPGEPGPGISQALARWRSAHYRVLRYDLRLHLTPALDRVHGLVGIDFAFVEQPVDLVLDWRPAQPGGMPPGRVKSVRVAGRVVP